MRCSKNIVNRIRIGWRKVRKVLHPLVTKGHSLQFKGRSYDACVLKAMLLDGEV